MRNPTRGLHHRSEPEARAERIGECINRQFNPDDLDLDHLAEAIRLLLSPDRRPDLKYANRLQPDLLLPPRRGSHVVGARRTP
jgi:hypothetical protein